MHIRPFAFFSSIAWVFLFPYFIWSDETSEVSEKETKLCLTMIVKDDAALIRQSLQSVEGIVDCMVICNAGSNDATIRFIEEFMDDNCIPGIIYRQEWKNVGYSRTSCIHTAQQTLKKLHFPLTSTYLLILDPDTRLDIEPSFDKAGLQLDAYLLAEKFSSFCYSNYNTHLLRASMPWEGIGVAHEYWSSKIPVQQVKLETLTIKSLGDDQYQKEKLSQDINRLTDALNNEPNNMHYLFYLANAHKCLKHYQEAIDCYRALLGK